MHAATVAVDLAKGVFELAFADAQCRIIERKRLSRNAFSKCLLNRPPLRVVMEACGSAHYWAHVFQAQGHTVRLLPAREVEVAAYIAVESAAWGVARVRHRDIDGRDDKKQHTHSSAR